METICKEVGARIRYFRKRQGYTLLTFAAALHRSRSVVSQYERGEISIDLMTLQQISFILRIPLNALVDSPINAVKPLFTKSSIQIDSPENMRQEYILTFPTQRRQFFAFTCCAIMKAEPTQLYILIQQRG